MVTVKNNVAEFRFYRPTARQAFIIGDFDNWSTDGLAMQRGPDGYWQASLSLPAGSYRFRYCADGQWFTDYAAFGLEMGPFGFDSVIRVEPEKHPPLKLTVRPKPSARRARRPEAITAA